MAESSLLAGVTSLIARAAAGEITHGTAALQVLELVYRGEDREGGRARRCWYCGVSFAKRHGHVGPRHPTKEHQVPAHRYPHVTYSGTIVQACSWCNQLKGGRDVEEFRAWLRGISPQWDGHFVGEAIDTSRWSTELAGPLWFGPSSYMWEVCRDTWAETRLPAE